MRTASGVADRRWGDVVADGEEIRAGAGIAEDMVYQDQAWIGVESGCKVGSGSSRQLGLPV